MPNYSGFEPQRPFGSFIEGMGAANKFQHSSLQNQSMQAALEQQKRQRETAEQFAATGDPRALRGYDPALAVTIESNLATMGINEQKAAIDRLKTATELTEKAFPYIVAASKSNPQAAANMYPEYVADMDNLGIKLPSFLRQYSPEAMESVLKYREDFKALVARTNAASREKIAAGNQATTVYSADRRYETGIDSAKIRAAAPRGAGGTGSNRFPNFNDYMASVRKGEDSVLPADAPYNQVMLQFNKNKTEGEAAGKAVYPKPPAPLKPVEEMLDKVINPQKYGGGGKQPAVSGSQRMLPSRDDPNKMVPATEAQYNAWHGIK